MEALDLLLESPVFALTFDIGHNHGIGGRDEGIILQRRERLRHFHFHDGVSLFSTQIFTSVGPMAASQRSRKPLIAVRYCS